MMPSPLAILDRVRRPAGLYELKVTLLETDPPIWRRIVVPADTTLGGTHRILQAVMGWMNSHLHVFTAGSVDYSEPGAEWDIPVRDERDVPLSQIARAAGDAFVYEYDLGDSWEHLITLEKIARRCDGAGTDCGSCRSEIQAHLEACRQQQVA